MSDDKAERRFWSKVDVSLDCWIWRGVIVRPDGYGQFFVDGERLRAHRVSYELHFGPIPDGMCVLHRCDNPSCVNPEHLFLGTHQDNMADRNAKGRSAGPKGALNAKAKLSEDDVRQIRKLRSEGMGYAEISSLFPVAETTVQKIVRKEIWTHVA